MFLCRYENDALTISTDITGNGNFDLCLRAEGVLLPTGYYFGISGATGDLSDNHDIIHMTTYELQADDIGVHRVHSTLRENIIPFAPKQGHEPQKNGEGSGWSLLKMGVALGAVVVLALFAYSLVAFSNTKPKGT